MSAPYLNKDGEDRSVVPLEALRRLMKERKQARTDVEHCELCSELIPADHQHLLDTSSLTVMCACQACSLLFNDKGAGGGKYRFIPKRYLALLDFWMSDEQWDEMTIPVNMVYIFQSTQANRIMAFYPSPAGAIESLLDLENWTSLISNNPILNTLEPDVEALLINRVRGADEYYIVPIDACYKLVGLIRVRWKGLGGGEEVWKEIEAFFADIQQKSEAVRGEPNA
ncbi:MAG TPA: DUF5947 family protein [Ktedonobacteraceae bacterium]|jgi:hypothetical protein|nr:DUF5947 family protein [Ktedonobacteraceae bacterium]